MVFHFFIIFRQFVFFIIFVSIWASLFGRFLVPIPSKTSSKNHQKNLTIFCIDFSSIFNGFGTPFSSQVGPCWRQVGHLGASWGSFWRSWATSWLQGAPQAPPRASRPRQTSISTDLGTIFGTIWGPHDAQVAAKMVTWTSIWTPQGCRITKKSTYKKISFDPTNTRGRRQRRQPLDI